MPSANDPEEKEGHNAYKPAMGIGSMQEVELSPCQRRSRLRGSIDRFRLHSPYVSGKDDISLWVLAALASVRRGAEAAEHTSYREQTHPEGLDCFAQGRTRDWSER